MRITLRTPLRKEKAHAHPDLHRLRLARGVVDSSRGGGLELIAAAVGPFKDLEFVEEAYAIKGREQAEATAMMMGRVSYEAFAPVWPDIEEFAYKVMPKYVVSTTLSEDDLVSNWAETTILRSLDEVAEPKETEGGPIIFHGSATLSRNLSDPGLIDRYHLRVYPPLLGAVNPGQPSSLHDRRRHPPVLRRLRDDAQSVNLLLAKEKELTRIPPPRSS